MTSGNGSGMGLTNSPTTGTRKPNSFGESHE